MNEPKKTALILPGGGAKARIQAGMLKAFHEAQIPYDSVRGTSAGALNAAVYQGGDLAGLIDLWMTVRNEDVYRPVPWRGLGNDAHFYDTAPLRRLIQHYVDPMAISASNIPLTVYATDTNYLVSVGLEIGKLLPDDARTALLASASLPILFPPVYMRGMRLADGGMGRNFPIMDAIDAGAERVIVLVPTGPAVPEHGNLKESFELLLESYGEGSFQQEMEAVEGIQESGHDVELIVVRPRLGHDAGGLLDFSMPTARRKELIEHGYEVARETFKRLGLWQVTENLSRQK